MKLATLLLSTSTLTLASPMSLDSRAVNYLSVINGWRSKGNLPLVAVSQTLVNNAHNARIASGTTLHHTLYPGTLAQVAAQVPDHNTLADFPDVYLQGWLCEKPSLSYLKGKCQSGSGGGETGHADIVTDPKYRHVGCSFGNVPNKSYGFIFCDWA